MEYGLIIEGDIVIGGLIDSPVDDRDWIAENIYPKDNIKVPKTLNLSKNLQKIIG